MSDLFTKILSLVYLMRPAEWTKSAGNMLIAAIVAHYMFNVNIDFLNLFYGVVSVCFLWSALYTVNDIFDKEVDALHPVKKKRPLPSGDVSINLAKLLVIVLLIISFWIGLNLGALFLTCLLAMTVNQVLYTIKPFNFKKRPIVDLISGSAINPIFRFYAGWILVMPTFNAPLLPLLFIVGLQFGGFCLYRMSSKNLEDELGYRSSVVLFGEKNLMILSYLAIAFGAVSFILMTLTGLEFLQGLKDWGYLPLKYGWLVLLSFLTFPSYQQALKDPKKIDIGKRYRIIYMHLLLFIVGFVALYFL
ncbi:MAG: hypothetical protein COT15_03395 [Candidatus Diapherotrites archaeon CG08_land_8_20_14_0_20_34_12]|nr:MAG: hypothetical protein COT15_03395 [Candidatus Diapherotrites archaeon CG08_land_8_20_14_0_20_34_12]